jgi:hypothetical protein
MGPQGFGHPQQGTNIFPLRRMKGSLSYDTSSSDPILTVVGMVFLLLIFTTACKKFAEQGDRRYAEERRRKSLITQHRSEWISHLKGLLFQSRTYITSGLYCSLTFLHKQPGVINNNSKSYLVSSSTSNQNLEKVASPVHENMSVLQHLYLELRQLFLRFKSHSISRRNWGISTKNITQGSSHLYDDKLASA